MVKDRYISTLLDFNFYEIRSGLEELNEKYNFRLIFKDKLKCIIIKK